MDTKEKIFSVLKDLAAAGQSNFARDLAALMRRMYPTDRKKVAEIMHPGRFKTAKTDSRTASEIERRTYVYPSSFDQQPAVITTSMSAQEDFTPAPPPRPAKKKAAAARPTPSDDEQIDSGGEAPEIVNIPTADGGFKPMTADQLLKMPDDEIVALFGTLKELKGYLVGVMQLDIPKNANTQSAVAAFKEQLSLLV
mgnify:CR=1 FL=1